MDTTYAMCTRIRTPNVGQLARLGHAWAHEHRASLPAKLDLHCARVATVQKAQAISILVDDVAWVGTAIDGEHQVVLAGDSTSRRVLGDPPGRHGPIGQAGRGGQA